MTDKEILEKTIQKAIDSGWTFFDYTDDDEFRFDVAIEEEANGGLLVVTHGSLGTIGWHPSIIIFTHQFAKALWGEKEQKKLPPLDEMTIEEAKAELKKFLEPTKNVLDWRFHLQQMVIAENPIEYLGYNL